MSEQIRDIDIVAKAIVRAEEFQLTTEVVWSALKAMKENPTLTIEQAITIGLEEWDLPLNEYHDEQIK